MPVYCPCCGKELTPANNDENCPNSPYWHGKHPIVVMPPELPPKQPALKQLRADPARESR